MPLGTYLEGVLFFVPTLGATLAAAYLLLRRRFDYLAGLPRLLAYAVLATATTTLAHVLPAALGILARESVLVAALVVLAAAGAVRHAPATARDLEPRPPASSYVSLLVAAVAVGAVVVFELARLRLLATRPITDLDMLGFHLPGMARWIQSGTLWRVDQFEPGFATAQYPNDGDFLIVSAILPWHDLAFARFVALPFYALTGVSTYALGLELGARRAAAATFAAAVVIVPALALLALEGLPDSIALAMLGTGLVFLVRHARSERRSDLLLAGLALGLALGTKWYGLTSVVAVVVVWAATWLLARRGPARVARDAARLIAMLVLGGGIWLLRNIIESGNPVYPKAVSVLGLHLFTGSHNDVVDRYGYTIADYLSKPHILGHIIYPEFKQRIGLAGAVLVIALAIAGVAAIRGLRRGDAERRSSAIVLALVVTALGMCALYAITPGSAYGTKDYPIETFANIRWLMPAILLGGALAARACASIGPAGLLLELAGLAGALDGIHLVASNSPPETKVTVGLAAKVALVLAALLVGGIAAKRWGRRRAPRPELALAAAGAVAIALIAAGRLDEHSFDRHGYGAYDPTLAWITAHASTGHRVGISGAASEAGISPVLPAFGPRLGNYVAYVGDRVRHSLALPASESGFHAEVRQSRYDLLLIGLQTTAHTDTWAQAAGYRLVTRSARLALYRAP